MCGCSLKGVGMISMGSAMTLAGEGATGTGAACTGGAGVSTDASDPIIETNTAVPSRSLSTSMSA